MFAGAPLPHKCCLLPLKGTLHTRRFPISHRPAVFGVQVEIVSALDHANELYVVVAGAALCLLSCAWFESACQSLACYAGWTSALWTRAS
jgi:hypothetical protein